MKFQPEFSSVVAFCEKPNCERSFLHRHHKGHEALWIAICPPAWKGKSWQDMKNRYAAFHPDDIIHICAWHHAEIHLFYDIEIERNQRRKKYKPLSRYTLREAKALSRKLAEICDGWLAKESPGVDPNYLRTFRSFPSTTEVF